jgi:hypothetical protein
MGLEYLVVLVIVINLVLAYYVARVLHQLKNFKLNGESYMYLPQDHLRTGHRRRRRRRNRGAKND